MRVSQAFYTWPGTSAIRTVQYPDNNQLASKSIDQLQPIRFGVLRASVIAKFGDMFEF